MVGNSWQAQNRYAEKGAQRVEDVIVVEEDIAFPEAYCVSCFDELSLWTGINDCLVVIRSLEKRLVPGDAPDNRLIVPFPDCPRFQYAFTKCLGWLIKAYQVPDAKLVIAQSLDARTEVSTIATVRALRFRPTVRIGGVGAILSFEPSLAGYIGNRRFAVIEDSPEIIELIQNPVRCMVSLLEQFWEHASELHDLKRKAEERTGGSSGMFYQPYTDGALSSLIEAIVLYVFDIDVSGSNSTRNGGINRGYRSFEVVSALPVDSRLLLAAHECCRVMFDGLS